MKGFPHLADEMINLYSPTVKTIQSPAIILALQHRFVNGFSTPKLPQFIYYKSGKASKEKVVRVKLKKGETAPIEFDAEIVSILKTSLCYDSKTYEYLKFRPHIQKLGIELMKSAKLKSV